MPYGTEHIWNWFVDIFNTGGIGMGPYRPSYLEIEAYSRVNHIQIRWWEAKAIRKLAEEYISFDSKRDKTQPQKQLTNLVPMDDAKAMGDFWRRIAKQPATPPKAKTTAK